MSYFHIKTFWSFRLGTVIDCAPLQGRRRRHSGATADGAARRQHDDADRRQRLLQVLVIASATIDGRRGRTSFTSARRLYAQFPAVRHTKMCTIEVSKISKKRRDAQTCPLIFVYVHLGALIESTKAPTLPIKESTTKATCLGEIL